MGPRDTLRVVRIAVVLVSLLAGCGADLGGPCSMTAPCSEGVCDLTDPAGASCVASDGDDDGDGILNERDFCQHLEGGAFDEDLDGLGDICDACPIAPPSATPDPDGDELESPCDPDPTIAGDRAVVFNGFNDATLPMGWRASALWRLVGGEIIVEAPAVLESLTVPLPLSSRHVAILARYRIDAIAAGASENAASVVGIDRRPAGLSVVSCGASRSGGTDRLLLDTDTSNIADDFTTSLFDPAGLYRVAAKIDNATTACALIADRETGATQASTTGQLMTEAGLTARSATVRFSYLLVVQRP